MKEFDGRVAIVTGAARGIGRATAHRLADGGANVVGFDLDAERLDKVVGELRGLRVRAAGVVGDVRSADDVGRLFDLTEREMGRLDVLVNNAGIWIIKSLEETSAEEWDRQIDTNLRALYLLVHRAIPVLRRGGGGAIVNLASMAASRFTVPHVAYASSKAATVALTRDLAVELAPDRVRVNAVAPGPIDTQGILEAQTPEEREAFNARFLLGRMGRPEDIAEAVAFLASDRAAYVTGATLPVTGGAELAIRPII